MSIRLLAVDVSMDVEICLTRCSVHIASTVGRCSALSASIAGSRSDVVKLWQSGWPSHQSRRYSPIMRLGLSCHLHVHDTNLAYHHKDEQFLGQGDPREHYCLVQIEQRSRAR